MTLMQRKIHGPVLIALVLLVLGLAPVAIAQPGNPDNPGNPPAHAGPPQDVVDQLLDRGFVQIQPSIFEREVEGTLSFENVVYGIDGHEWLLAQQETFLEFLEARYQEYPAVELLDAIAAQERRIARTEALLAEMRAAEAGNTSGGSLSEGLTSVRLGAEEILSTADAVSCTTTLNRSADAWPGSSGPHATGAASFSDNCSLTGTVSSLATAQGKDSTGNIITYSDECPSKTGSNVSCSSSATVNAVTECYSHGQGDVTFGFFTYTASKDNFVCRMLTATLTGSTYIYVPWGTTRYGYWSVSASNGTPSYRYQWYFNNAAVGTNSTTYSRAFPHPGYGTTRYYTIRTLVTDSSSPALSVYALPNPLNLTVVYDPGTCDPCTQICPVVTTGSGWSAVNVVPQPCIQPQ
jgi:hypothetical protein